MKTILTFVHKPSSPVLVYPRMNQLQNVTKSMNLFIFLVWLKTISKLNVNEVSTNYGFQFTDAEFFFFFFSWQLLESKASCQ